MPIIAHWETAKAVLRLRPGVKVEQNLDNQKALIDTVMWRVGNGVAANVPRHWIDSVLPQLTILGVFDE